MKKQLNLQTIAISFGGLLIVNIMSLLLPKFWTNVLIGKANLLTSPTFQDVMWLLFFYGAVLLFHRKKNFKQQQKHWDEDYLPEDFEVIIDAKKLTEIIRRVKTAKAESVDVLPYMILQIALQFRTNNSIALTNDFLSKQIDLFLHSIELNFNQLKYIIWVIPSLGFMGTVYGIGLAVSKLGEGALDDPALLTNMASDLGVAFNTTLLALVLSVILQFFVQSSEGKEEQEVNRYGKYILDNLINKIVEK